MSKTALVIQGGGFRTAFTAGVLDAFLITSRLQFDHYFGVSGGSIALSYYLSRQYGYCFSAMQLLAKDPDFVQMKRAMSEQGYMDIDYLEKIAQEIMPLDIGRAQEELGKSDLSLVVTDRSSGKAVYLSPVPNTWISEVIASCTLPFVTKGVYTIGDKKYFDGGWSDPIPAKKAYREGAREILVICTSPVNMKLKQSWPDYLGSIYFRSSPDLSSCFALAHEEYNKALDFIARPPMDAQIDVIAPKEILESGMYSYSGDSLTQDYRHGLDMGLRYIQKKKTSS
jgi:predicted patatin/cPLA2 family phospholipase